jgi:acetyl esterase
MQVFLSGGKPIVIEGQTLHPEMQLLLSARKRMGYGAVSDDDMVRARRRLRREILRFRGLVPPVHAVHDLQIDGGSGPIAARHYVPDEPGGPHPLLVYFHGGGFVTGDLDTHDVPCRLLCRHAGVHVLAVDYRLAPEHPFPAALDDAMQAFHWAVAHARTLSADGERVSVGGDSAGGNLAAVVSRLCARAGGPAPALQLLVYPVTDLVNQRPSVNSFGDGFLLTQADMKRYETAYVAGSKEKLADDRISPLLAADLSGLCPAIVITAGFDPLRDEGEAYAAALEAAGTRVQRKRLEGYVHGFVSMGGVSPAAERAMLEIADKLRHLSRETRTTSLQNSM